MEKTWMDVLIYVIEVVVGLVVSVGIPYLFSFLRSKAQNEKAQEYIALAQRYLADAVAMVNQTFVDQLKQDGKFDAEAQKEAFQMASDAWLDMMSEEMKQIIIDEVGDFETYVKTEIEARVSYLKS